MAYSTPTSAGTTTEAFHSSQTKDAHNYYGKSKDEPNRDIRRHTYRLITTYTAQYGIGVQKPIQDTSR